jgi:hypothetical protein
MPKTDAEKRVLECPFCGKAPEVYGSGEGQRGLMIHCITDGCVNPHVSYYDHKSARAVWNRRATDNRVTDDPTQSPQSEIETDENPPPIVAKFYDTFLKAVGHRWKCAGCEQTFGADDRSFRTTMSGEVERYCINCCKENG